MAIHTTPEAQALGVNVDVEAKRPIISTDRKSIGWFLIGDPAFADASAFAGTGTQIGTVVTVRTDADPPRTYQRTFYTETEQK